MAGHARYTAVLDACVLYPIVTADALLSIAVTGLYAPKWTPRIEDEWMRALEERHQKPVGAFARRRDFMRLAVPDWSVDEEACKRLEAVPYSMPDPDDVHVLAAAIAGHADAIVTSNLRDFPEAILAPFGIQAIHPDDFLVAQMDLDALAALVALKEMRQRRRQPALTAEAFAEAFERAGLVATAQRLRDAAALI